MYFINIFLFYFWRFINKLQLSILSINNIINYNIKLSLLNKCFRFGY